MRLEDLVESAFDGEAEDVRREDGLVRFRWQGADWGVTPGLAVSRNRYSPPLIGILVERLLWKSLPTCRNTACVEGNVWITCSIPHAEHGGRTCDSRMEKCPNCGGTGRELAS